MLQNSNSEKTRAILITHKEDIDGMVSAALLYSDLRKKGHSQIDICLIDYTSIIALFENNMENLKNQTLYLADIGINEQLYELLLQLPPIASLPEGIHRYYFDHHVINGDISEMRCEIEKRFHVYKNPALDQFAVNCCTSEVIYSSLAYNNSHYKCLCEYAHMGDFNKEGNREQIKSVVELSMFITYYQHTDSRLADLLVSMQKPETWESYLKSFVHNAEEISIWVATNHEEIEKNLIRIKGGFRTILISVADLKSEDIVYYLKKSVPGYDIYLGFSKRNNYANIQTDLGVAHIIASYFRGGGHHGRAGFKIPDEIQIYINDRRFSHIVESVFIKQLKLILSEIGT